MIHILPIEAEVVRTPLGPFARHRCRELPIPLPRLKYLEGCRLPCPGCGEPLLVHFVREFSKVARWS